MIEKANAEGGLEITLRDMTDVGGNGPNQPAQGPGWNQAARFVNWLNTSRGSLTGLQVRHTTRRRRLQRGREHLAVGIWRSGFQFRQPIP